MTAGLSGDPQHAPRAPLRCRLPRRAATFFVLACALASHLPALGVGFVSDDVLAVENNPIFARPADWTVFLTAPGRAVPAFPHFRPAVLLSYGLETVIWGRSAVVYHVTNVLLHVLAVALVLKLAGTLSPWPHRGGRAGMAAALLFAIHPMTVEATSFIWARSSLLFSVFAVAAVLLFARYRRADRPGSLVLSLSCYVLSLLSKEQAVALPALLLLVDAPYWLPPGSYLPGWQRRPPTLSPPAGGGRYGGGPGLPRLAAHAAFVAITVLYLWLRRYVLGSIGNPHPERPFAADIKVQMISLAEYLRRWSMGLGLGLGEHRPPPPPLLDAVAAALPALVVLAGAAFWWYRRRDAVSAGALWFSAAIFPVCLPVGFQAPVKEHYSYLAGIGVCVTLASLAMHLVSRAPRGTSAAFPRPLLQVAVLAAAVALGGETYRRGQMWVSQLPLAAEAAARYPNNPLHLSSYAFRLVDLGRLAEAAALLERAARFDPPFPGALVGLAAIAERTGDPLQAEQYYRRAIAADTKDPFAPQSYAGFLKRMRRFEDAAVVLADTAGRIGAANARIELGRTLLALGRPREAMAAFSRCLAAIPGHAAAAEGLAIATWAAGDRREGRRLYHGLVSGLSDAQADLVLGRVYRDFRLSSGALAAPPAPGPAAGGAGGSANANTR
ncbi:MAG: hypothetical protein HYV63_25685 [Candidatus Schekmanbacteria bacterium]|nr:hypothetical protein [Candidatus Schekmanbacteria bacterium]